jgi:hypothetical protein
VVAGTSADFLLHLCDSDDERSLFACSACISGATEMFVVYQRHAGVSGAGGYCPPHTLGSDEVEKIWREELSAMRHPEKRRRVDTVSFIGRRLSLPRSPGAMSR